MSIDKQRIAAVRKLEDLGLVWDGIVWTGTPRLDDLAPEADALHGLLMDRAVALAGCTEESDPEGLLSEIGEALET